MKFKIGPVPDSPDFIPQDSWKPLREPGPILLQFLAAPIAVILLVASALLWFFFFPSLENLSRADLILLLCLFPLSILIVPIHELCHAWSFPDFGRSSHTTIGLWPARLLFYATHDGELPRGHLIFVLLAPFLALSVLPLMVCLILGFAPPFVCLISVMNASFACGDILGVGLVLAGTPPGATLRNKGYHTFWRPRAS